MIRKSFVIVALFFIFLIYSCEHVSKNKNKVRRFPVYPGCEQFQSARAQKDCFIDNFYKKIKGWMQEQTFQPVTGDTLFLRFTIDKKGKIIFDTLYPFRQDAYQEAFDYFSGKTGSLPAMEWKNKQDVKEPLIFEVPVLVQ